jgi:hypothetical protein
MAKTTKKGSAAQTKRASLDAGDHSFSLQHGLFAADPFT